MNIIAIVTVCSVGKLARTSSSSSVKSRTTKVRRVRNIGVGRGKTSIRGVDRGHVTKHAVFISAAVVGRGATHTVCGIVETITGAFVPQGLAAAGGVVVAVHGVIVVHGVTKRTSFAMAITSAMVGVSAATVALLAAATGCEGGRGSVVHHGAEHMRLCHGRHGFDPHSLH